MCLLYISYSLELGEVNDDRQRHRCSHDTSKAVWIKSRANKIFGHKVSVGTFDGYAHSVDKVNISASWPQSSTCARARPLAYTTRH